MWMYSFFKLTQNDIKYAQRKEEIGNQMTDLQLPGVHLLSGRFFAVQKTVSIDENLYWIMFKDWEKDSLFCNVKILAKQGSSASNIYWRFDGLEESWRRVNNFSFSNAFCGKSKLMNEEQCWWDYVHLIILVNVNKY